MAISVAYNLPIQIDTEIQLQKTTMTLVSSSPNPTTAQLEPQQRLQTILERLESVCRLVDEEIHAGSVRRTDDGTPLFNDKVSIVIPVYNEEATLGLVVSRVAALPLYSEIIIVDDFSTDGTREILAQLSEIDGVKIILKERNEGKGAALRTGFEAATGDFVVVQDADLEYNPRDIPRLIEPLSKGECDIVFGSRFIGEEQQDESMIHRFGNWVLTTASNIFNGVALTDMETCYKAFRRSTMKGIKIKQNRFGVEPELTAKWARRGYRFKEVPISYEARGYEDGKKIGIRDLFQAVYCICRYGIAD